MKLGQTVLGKKLFALLMKQTFYGQFVAGEVGKTLAYQIYHMTEGPL